MPPLLSIFIGAIIGGLVSLSLNIVKVLADSITASQKPRLESVRQAVIHFNEGLFLLALITREQGLARYKAANEEEYGEDRFSKYEQILDDGMKELSNSCGLLLSIGQCGLGNEIRNFNNEIMNLVESHKSDGEWQTYNEFRSECDTLIIKRRNSISDRFARLLEEESRLSHAINRYFGK